MIISCKSVGSEKSHVYRWMMVMINERCRVAWWWGLDSHDDSDECHPDRDGINEDVDEEGLDALTSFYPGDDCWWRWWDDQSWCWCNEEWGRRWRHVARNGSSRTRRDKMRRAMMMACSRRMLGLMMRVWQCLLGVLGLMSLSWVRFTRSFPWGGWRHDE